MNPESETERGGDRWGETEKINIKGYHAKLPYRFTHSRKTVNFTVLYAKEYINENNLYLCQTEIIIIII